MLPGQFIPGADSHSRAYGAYGAVGFGVGSTTLGFGWSTGYIYFTVAKQRRVVFRGALQPWVSGKDIVLELLRRWGAKQSGGMSVEFVDAERQLPIAVPQHDREHDGGGRGAERHLRGGRSHGCLVPRQGDRAGDLPYPRVSPGRDASYEIDETLELDAVQPMIAKPYSPGQRLSRGRGGAGAAHVRQGPDRLLHERQLRRPALRGAGSARRPRAGLPRGGEVAGGLSGLGWSGDPDRGGGPAPRRGVDRGRLPVRRRRDPPVLVRPVLRPGPRRASPRDSARSRPSTGTGRTGWAWAARATSRAPPSSRRPPSSGTWRRRASSASPGNRSGSGSDRPTARGFDYRASISRERTGQYAPWSCRVHQAPVALSRQRGP